CCGGGRTAAACGFLGMNARQCRGLVPGDGRSGAPPVAVMSYRLCQKEFNGDPKLVGSVLTLNGKPTTLVGIMPPRFLFGGNEIWLPLSLNRNQPEGVFQDVWTLGRLKPGVSLRAAASDLLVIAKRLSTV